VVEKSVITRRLAYLDEYCRDLEEAKTKVSWEQFLNDKVVRRYIERTLHMAIEACIDIANHIISYHGYREPESNRELFQILTEQGIIPNKLAENLKKMAQFRNIIVHDYIRIQPEIVYAILKNNLTDIIEYANIVKEKFFL